MTHYVGTDGAEGVGTAHIEMSAVEPQENFDVIEAIGLKENKRQVQKCPETHFQVPFSLISNAFYDTCTVIQQKIDARVDS